MFSYTREKTRQFVWDTMHRIAIFPKESSNNILVVQEEGIGNSILTTPLIQALATLTPARKIDVLIDYNKGTDVVFSNWNLINQVWDMNKLKERTDRLFYSHVLECHPRHYIPHCIKYHKRYRIGINQEDGLDYHWCFNKHESDYLLDLARNIGYKGTRPEIRKLVGDKNHGLTIQPNTVAIGIGYSKGKRPDGRDWSDRHWGNENFTKLCTRLVEHKFHPVLVGDIKDFNHDGHILYEAGIDSICGKLSLPQIVDYISKCYAYIGNDTGLMHIAASVNIFTIGIFVTTNSIKSYPLCPRCIAIGGDRGKRFYDIDVDQIWDVFIRGQSV